MDVDHSPVERLGSSNADFYTESGLRRHLMDGIVAGPDTVALAAIAFCGSEAVVAHVGNVRCYRARDGWLATLTRDHSATAELRVANAGAGARRAPFQIHHLNLLTRGLGLGPSVEPEVSTRSARRGDRFVLCTASVWSELSEEQLRGALDHADDAEDACRLLRSHLEARNSEYVILVADLCRRVRASGSPQR